MQEAANEEAGLSKENILAINELKIKVMIMVFRDHGHPWISMVYSLSEWIYLSP